MTKYWRVFLNYLQSKAEYRSDLAGIIAIQTVGLIGIFLLWSSVFQNSASIGGYSKIQTIAYYVLIPLVGFFTVVDISSRFGGQIQNGFFSSLLIKPYKVWLDVVMRAVSDRVDSLVLIVPLYSIFIYLFSTATGIPIVSISNLPLFLLIVLVGFCLNFAIDIAICWLSFWLTDIWSFKHFKYFVFYVLGGVNFPLDFLPSSVRQIFEFLPFKYLYYIPVSYLTGRRGDAEIFQDLATAFIWIIVFLLVAWFLWKKGIKKYESVGN